MTDFNLSLLLSDAVELAAKLNSGEMSSEQLTAQTLAAIDHWNPAINCYVALDGKAATQAAREADARRGQGTLLSPLDGLTFAVKDNIDVAGFVTSAGLAIQRDPAVADAFVVQRLREAGCIPLGKLNMHAAALGASNANSHFGNCYNPHRPGFTPGGSSGGSGAAVAAGLCAFALGTDTMGSVRVPAAYCGVSGIKPTAGAVSISGTVELSRRLDNIGALARSPRDLSIIHDMIAVYDDSCAQSQVLNFPDLMTDIDKLSFSVAVDLARAGVKTDMAESFRRATSIFSQAGATVQDKSLAEFDFGAVRRAGLLLCEANLLIDQQHWIDSQPAAYPEDLLQLLDWARGKSAADVIRAERVLDDGVLVMRQLLASSDFLLLPTTPQSAFNFAEPVPAGQADLTAIANMAGYPAVTVPMGDSNTGLPQGLQIVGAPGSDRQLLVLAHWFSQSLNLPRRTPGALV